MAKKVTKTDAEWRAQLTPEQYRVMREKGTERAHTGKYAKTTDAGTYKCAGCGEPLFASETKFDAHCGGRASRRRSMVPRWRSRTTRRTACGAPEVLCSACDAHLGHVFR